MQYNRRCRAKKKAKNISINSDLLKKAKQYKINISANVEKTLEALIYEYEKANWEEQNRVAIDDYNKRVKKEGLFSDHFRYLYLQKKQLLEHLKYMQFDINVLY